ncbi:MAG: methionine--tRNA ligase [Actinomycetes bacterium]
MAGDATTKAFYVTTPIYYVNDAPHIGHAYTTVAGDVLTRWHRQRGEPVHFLTGTDEHGEKLLQAAQARDMTPQAWTDYMVETAWRPMLAAIDVANDDFIRTTEERHTARVQEFWQRIYDAGEVYKGTYTGPYCVHCEEFKIPSELLQPGDRCPIHDRPVEMLSEDNYFFKLTSYAEQLLAHYREHPEFVQPETARNEVVRFVEGGLQDLSITRSTFDWGVPVPWDTSHVLYVWIDALLNYVTAIGYGVDEGRFESIWPADVHLVGKDILRFHAVIWPAMLMAAGLPLPKTVFANGWLLVGGEKMSKTKLTGIPPQQVTDHFGSDAYRYYFLREIAFGQDGSFSWESMAARYQSELADQFGNLASRLTSMVERYRGGSLPSVVDEPALSAALAKAAATADTTMRALDFQAGLTAIFEFIRAVNGYVTEQEPWQLAKDDARAADLDRVLYATAESLRACAVLLNPVMPKACERLWSMLGAEAALGPLASQLIQDVARWGQLPAGAKVAKGDALFPRLEEPPA